MQTPVDLRGRSLGPLLYFRGMVDGRVALTAIVATASGTAPPALRAEGVDVPPRRILRAPGVDVHRYALDLPARAGASYTFDGAEIPVACDLAGDLRIGFAACNGQESGDFARDADERNAMWRRLGALHREAPFHLLLQGGDQIYADEVTRAHPLSSDWPREVAGMSLDALQLASLYDSLLEAFVHRYVATFSQPEYAWLAARVPTLAMWDDHDICDGWGSRSEAVLRSDIGQALFAVARRTFLVFQMGEAPDEVPAHVSAAGGDGLSWRVDLPGLRIVAPDLRTERTKARVLGQAGWRAFEASLKDPPERLLLVSSVPLLGPRLSLSRRSWSARPGPRSTRTTCATSGRAARTARNGAPPSRLVAVHERGTALYRRLGRDPPRHPRHDGDRARAAAPARRLRHLAPAPRRAPTPARSARWRGWERRPCRRTRSGSARCPASARSTWPSATSSCSSGRDRAWSAYWELENSGRTPPLPL